MGRGRILLETVGRLTAVELPESEVKEASATLLDVDSNEVGEPRVASPATTVPIPTRIGSAPITREADKTVILT